MPMLESGGHAANRRRTSSASALAARGQPDTRGGAFAPALIGDTAKPRAASANAALSLLTLPLPVSLHYDALSEQWETRSPCRRGPHHLLHHLAGALSALLGDLNVAVVVRMQHDLSFTLVEAQHQVAQYIAAETLYDVVE